MSFQTIFYDLESHKILHVEQCLYIKSVAHKKNITKQFSNKYISFFYYPQLWPKITPAYKITFQFDPRTPMILTANDLPVCAARWQRDFDIALSNGPLINVFFEGGMGDMLMQSAALLACMRKYPTFQFKAFVNPNFLPVSHLINNIVFLPRLNPLSSYKKSKNNLFIAPDIPVDPRGDYYGKKDLYGLFFGLLQVDYRLNFNLSLLPSFEDISIFKMFNIQPSDSFSVIHPFSASGFNKCMRENFIFDLCRYIKKDTDKRIFILGGRQDKISYSRLYSPLINKLSWLDTIVLLQNASMVYAVDSSIMHLCYVLNIPCFRFWSETSPLNILGCPWTDFDHSLNLPFIDLSADTNR